MIPTGIPGGVLTKSAEWQPEQEWRMVFPTPAESQNGFPVPMPPKALYLGVKMPADYLSSFLLDNHAEIAYVTLSIHYDLGDDPLIFRIAPIQHNPARIAVNLG